LKPSLLIFDLRQTTKNSTSSVMSVTELLAKTVILVVGHFAENDPLSRVVDPLLAKQLFFESFHVSSFYPPPDFNADRPRRDRGRGHGRS
jgi:hypothetical protein